MRCRTELGGSDENIVLCVNWCSQRKNSARYKLCAVYRVQSRNSRDNVRASRPVLRRNYIAEFFNDLERIAQAHKVDHVSQHFAYMYLSNCGFPSCQSSESRDKVLHAGHSGQCCAGGAKRSFSMIGKKRTGATASSIDYPSDRYIGKKQ